jgi:hypothetical protein
MTTMLLPSERPTRIKFCISWGGIPFGVGGCWDLWGGGRLPTYLKKRLCGNGLHFIFCPSHRCYLKFTYRIIVVCLAVQLFMWQPQAMGRYFYLSLSSISTLELVHICWWRYQGILLCAHNVCRNWHMAGRQVRVGGKTRIAQRGIASPTTVADDQIHRRVWHAPQSCLLCFVLTESEYSTVKYSLRHSSCKFPEDPWEPSINLERPISSSLATSPAIGPMSPLSLVSTLWYI